MIFGRTLFLTGICLAWAVMCHAGSLEEVQKAAEKIESVNGDFIQEKQMPILVQPIVARGYFAYLRPASLRWEYKDPMQSVTLLHDGQVHRYVPSGSDWKEEKTPNAQSMDFILQEVAKWLNGKFEENKIFNVKLTIDDTIVMTPKTNDMAQFIQRIELTMGDNPGVIKEVIIFESKDSFTRFTFPDPHINQPISPETFKKIK